MPIRVPSPVLTLVLYAASLAVACAPLLMPAGAGPVAVIIPGGSAVAVIAEADGVIVRTGPIAAVAVANGDALFRQRAQAAGAILLSPIAGLGCTTPVSGSSPI